MSAPDPGGHPENEEDGVEFGKQWRWLDLFSCLLLAIWGGGLRSIHY